MRRPSRSPLFATTLIVALVVLAVTGLRLGRALESLELGAYDAFVRLRPVAASDPRVALVTITEQDIQALGVWPLPDGVLARALAAIGREQPRAIGLDIYRDIPVPPGHEELLVLFTREPRLVAVTKFGASSPGLVPPPPALRGTDQIGFNDIVIDPGGTVRRGLLFLDDGTNAYSAFALQLALRYLAPEGIGLAPDPRDERLLRLGRTTIRPLEAWDGGYAGADARGYQFLIDFARRPGSFTAVTLGDLLADRIPQGALRDRVVLVGVTAESIKDDFFTPFSRGLGGTGQMPGVEVHAHIAGQLLRMALDGAAPMAAVPHWAALLWTVVWTAAGAAVASRLASPWKFAMVALAGVAALGAIDFTAFVRGWWVPFVPPLTGWLASSSLVTAYMSYRQSAERSMLMQLFSRHVSKEVAESIWEQREQFLDGGRPRPERLVVTALFTDLTGFTTVSERSAPDALMEWLNEYMDAMAQQVSRHGGVIRQYAGDSVVAMFGVPVSRRDDAEIAQDAVNAVECALAMGDALLELNRRWKAEGRPITGMRVGIFTGQAVAGILGSAQRSEYVVVGDTMNTASRLESFDKELFLPDPLVSPCRVLIGEPTLRLLGDRFITEWVADASLKGKEHTVGVYRVTSRAGGARAPIDERRECRAPRGSGGKAMNGWGLLAVVTVAAPLFLATPRAVEAQERPSGGQAVAAPQYKPPLRGAPGGRVGGGTRGTGREPAFVLSVLAPNHTALTTVEQPALYWYISSESSYPIEVTIVDPNATEPLLELRLPPPIKPGIHRIVLAEHNTRLVAGTAYQWFVAVVPDAGRRSKDIVAAAMIERVPPPPEVASRVGATPRGDLPRLYAEAGLWYDAIAAVSDLVDAAPGDTAPRTQRAALLRQVGLSQVADSE